MADITNETQAVQANQRPPFLTVLCILTFIGSGLMAIISLLGLVASGALEGIASQIPGMPAVSGGGALLKVAVSFLLYLGSLYGAFQMWNLKKLGFYVYTGAQVVLLILAFGWISLFFTALFILLYGLNLKHLE
ncbi:MAG: hypothetical protein ACLFUC_09870 [Bacteroidales bacterium]